MSDRSKEQHIMCLLFELMRCGKPEHGPQCMREAGQCICQSISRYLLQVPEQYAADSVGSACLGAGS